MDFKILYEDKNFVAIDKPTGIMVHQDGKNSEQTVADWMLAKYPETENVGEFLGDIKRPGVVHRLDKDTSGVLILAKNQEAHQFLKKQFQEHKVKKTYHALVYGWVKKDHGIIDEPIGRSPRDFRRRLAGRGARGEMREAITEYQVIKRFEDSEGNKFSFLEIKPKTGRTHQIRVHMKFLNYPVVCDKLYAPMQTCPHHIGRLALHAYAIEFLNKDDDLIKIISPTPNEFA